MKVLLLNTSQHYHPSLGLGYIASSSLKAFGNAVTFKIANSNIVENIRLFQPDIVGITSMTINYNKAKHYAMTAKVFNLPVIIGGVHISQLPESLTTDMDIAVISEGEETIVDLLSSFMANGYLDTAIDGIAYHAGGELITNKPRKLIKSLDSISYPARDLTKITNMPCMLTSRGCPYRCIFCSTSKNFRYQVRYASAEYAVGEVEMLYRDYGAIYIEIYDDLFAMDTKRVIEIQRLMAAKNLIGKFGISVNIRSDLITDELAEILYAMNVDVVGLGVESGCQKTIDYLKSGTLTVEDNLNAIRILRNHRITPYCSFIIGSPSESMSDIMQTINFIKDNGLYHFDIGVPMPFPGTPLWDYALSHSLVSNDMDWSKLDYTTTPGHVIISDNLSHRELEGIIIEILKRKNGYRALFVRLSTLKHPYRFLGNGIKAGIRGLR